jgi:hypothetical protein
MHAELSAAAYPDRGADSNPQTLMSWCLGGSRKTADQIYLLFMRSELFQMLEQILALRNRARRIDM